MANAFSAISFLFGAAAKRSYFPWNRALVLFLLAVICAPRIFAQQADTPIADFAATQPASGAPDVPLLAQSAIEFADRAAPGLLMPTDVAVARDGRVFVADGVNDRIVVFNPAGHVAREIRRVADQSLAHPVGIDVDASGNLWIADAGNARIVVANVPAAADAPIELIRIIPLPAGPNDHPADPTDAAVSPDGAVVWTVDNNRHVLIRHDVKRGTHALAGRQGEARGQLHYPFMLARDAKGNVYASDVLNGRVGVFSDTGGVVTSIAQYGVEPGMLYRPKGVALDADGNVWVSDSVLGVVQVFTSTGRFIDVLRDASGKPLKLAAPMGMAFDASGDLYVVELDANRVRSFRIVRRADAGASARDESRSATQRPSVVGRQARACTVCHMEWVEPLAQKRGTELINPPDDDPVHPYVSQPHTCLSCHDGSIVDSRRRVWLEHGHRTDIAPLPEMTVPPQLPLVDGKIACRTCHSAHAGGDLSGNLKTSVFLRMPNTSGEMCVTCHADKTRGPQRGTHPTGGMPWAVPNDLIAAGAKVGPNPRELTCNVCHTPHGAAYDHLLVMGTESNQLCLSCHDQMRPGMFRDGDHTEHPLSPIVNTEQKAAIQSLGTKLGPDDKLICLSCHKLHHGKGERFMLAAELTDGAFCVGCHSAKTSVFKTPHDLRKTYPEERNRLGMTAQTGGPCSSCHLFHRYARSPEISDIDPGGGKCITCHQEGRCAGEKALGSFNHPKAACVECHDPHGPHEPNRPALGQFLREPTPGLCVKCHAEYAALSGGPHDFRSTGNQWPQVADLREDTCLACHRPHGKDDKGLFTFAASPADAASDGACIACHPGAAWGHGADGEGLKQSDHAAMHPRIVPAGFATGGLPLARSASTEASVVGCRTCHNPHAADGAAHKFLRTAAGAPASSLCITCHSDASAITMTAHTAATFESKQLPAQACLPCHSVHAMPTAVEDDLLWPRSLAVAEESASPRAMPQAAAPREAINFAAMHASDQRCEACHREGGTARPPMIASHPDVPMLNIFDGTRDESLPLYDVEGRTASQGQIACRTCHTPHGHLPDTEFSGPDRSREALRSARLMLRPFRAPNVCTTCHGFDALERFLFFHDPVRRRK
ncbi:Serine/threonine-protein kinase PknD [Phycisphaerae bacterium RAS2]|nr:Serine/threonine-protein kinase PknD [Phycisphaerae bacterium RAS2]